MTEPAGTPVAGIKFFDHFELDLGDRDDNHLCDSLAGLDLVGLAATIPA